MRENAGEGERMRERQCERMRRERENAREMQRDAERKMRIVLVKMRIISTCFRPPASADVTLIILILRVRFSFFK